MLENVTRTTNPLRASAVATDPELGADTLRGLAVATIASADIATTPTEPLSES